MVRKMTLLIIALSMGAILPACGNSGEVIDKPDTKAENVERSKVEIDEKEPEVEDKKSGGATKADTKRRKAEEENTKFFELGEKVSLDGFDMTVDSLGLGKETRVDEEDREALIINYTWVNTSDGDIRPTGDFIFRGKQDDRKTYDIMVTNVEGVNLNPGQGTYGPGESIKGQYTVGIDDLDKELVLELNNFLSGGEKPYQLKINPLDYK